MHTWRKLESAIKVSQKRISLREIVCKENGMIGEFLKEEENNFIPFIYPIFLYVLTSSLSLFYLEDKPLSPLNKQGNKIWRQ